MRILPSGATALLAELDDIEQALALYRKWHEDPPCDVVDIVPGARTVLFKIDPSRTRLDELERAIRTPFAPCGNESSETLVELPVSYEGDDLAEVAGILGCTTEAVIHRHTGTEWRVAFCGFAPGFAYLHPVHGEWNLPRRDTPRTHVPAGSVGLAGALSGVYPRSSPGGWQLIGRTAVELFDQSRTPPALLTPGTRVRFTAS
ncbi:5-oxoprolinase subunit B family protein [Sciscionella sediminilitoris]|uniref:5-oxoprolinase subunit B family protein n=1 Tax=Sciscionella sediminilitoris TaxID=1445613 RepID=UPI0004DF9AAA|nr:allophanate hydrolase subunit 1 [Sciscionella sp. SE31]